jgi:choline dehydrogenase-like flavoprotein
MLMPGFGREHLNLMRKYRYYASMEVAIRDEPVGKIELDPKGERLKVTKRLTDLDRKRGRDGLALVNEMFAKAGAKDIVSCTQGFGLHLMGGCTLGVDAKTSVIGPDFRVHGEPNLFAADSSTFPAAPGINPSFTVMALSHRATQSMLKGA